MTGRELVETILEMNEDDISPQLAAKVWEASFKEWLTLTPKQVAFFNQRRKQEHWEDEEND